jgi:antitoxin ParD1/3/4
LQHSSGRDILPQEVEEMAEIERLSVALPEPMAKSVRKAVADGEYASTSEVIRDALRLWESRRQLRERDVAVLRSRWDEGKASGRAGRLDLKRVLAEERATFKGVTRRRG